MGNYQRLLSGEFASFEDPPHEHTELLSQLDQEMESYLQEVNEWIEAVKANPAHDNQEGEQ